MIPFAPFASFAPFALFAFPIGDGDGGDDDRDPDQSRMALLMGRVEQSIGSGIVCIGSFLLKPVGECGHETGLGKSGG